MHLTFSICFALLNHKTSSQPEFEYKEWATDEIKHEKEKTSSAGGVERNWKREGGEIKKEIWSKVRSKKGALENISVVCLACPEIERRDES